MSETSSTLITETSTPNDASTATTDATTSTSTATAADKPVDQTASQQQTSTEAKPDDKPAEQEGEKKPEAKTDDESAKPKAPEKYEFKTPEGVTLDTALLGDFEGIAKELDLPQEAAQKVIDKLAPRMVQRAVEQQAEVLQRAATEWANASTADKEIGGDKLTENLTTAKKALEAFGTPELRTLLDESRMGNHPEVIRLLTRVGKAISEDKVVIGRAGGGEAKSHAEALYGKS